MTRAWRICKARRAANAFDGQGAFRAGGRWNSPGVAVVYVADSLAAAMLEIIVHTDSAALLLSYVATAVDIPDQLIQVLPAIALSPDWVKDQSLTRSAGDAWAAAGESAALKVPSAIVPGEFNFVLNPGHNDFSKFIICQALPLSFDNRFKR